MLRLISNLWQSLIHGKPDEIVDHLPISGHRNYAKKLAKARARHGKDFHCQTKIERKEPASRDLLELNQASKPATLIVVEENIPAIANGRRAR